MILSHSVHLVIMCGEQIFPQIVQFCQVVHL